MLNGLKVIALEEHYSDPAIDARTGLRAAGPLSETLQEIGSERLKLMDAAGIDLQVLSLAPPGLQAIGASEAPHAARSANDYLREKIGHHPGRLAGFAALPSEDPKAAADELKRCVNELGFLGAMVHGPSKGRFLDDPFFEPIFEAAAALRVPIYLHPANIMPVVREAYIGDYARTHPMFAMAAWGFTIETGTHAMRLVLSGLFDKFPDLRVILGHFGEAIPFLLERIDESLRRNTPMGNFREVFTHGFYVTTSGFFSTPALQCCIRELGVERILFSVDWPFVSNEMATDWFASVPLSKEEKAEILSRNFERLVGQTLPRINAT